MTEEQLTRAAAVIGFTVAYSLAGFFSKKAENGAKFSFKKFGTTVLVGLVTGAIVYQAGDAATPEVIVSASATAVYVVDQGLNMVMDEPPEVDPIQKP